MKFWHAMPHLQEQGCRVLQAITYCDEFARAAVDAGAAQAVVGAMRAHENNVALQEQGCEALSNMSAGARRDVQRSALRAERRTQRICTHHARARLDAQI